MTFRKQTTVSRPMARTDGLLVESVADETVVYDQETKEAHCLKALAAAVFTYADGRNTTAEIAELVSYRLDRTVSEAEVADAVRQLEQHALLDTPLVIREGLSRREALRTMAATGVGAVAGASLITTILAPTAAAAGSQLTNGSCCGNSATDNCTGGNPKCQSGHCCQNLSSKDCNLCKCVGDKNDCSSTQCSGTGSGCPDITVTISGVSTTLHACGKTSGGRCCYPDTLGNCCTVNEQGTTNVVLAC
jgi:hypothetical protein